MNYEHHMQPLCFLKLGLVLNPASIAECLDCEFSFRALLHDLDQNTWHRFFFLSLKAIFSSLYLKEAIPAKEQEGHDQTCCDGLHHAWDLPQHVQQEEEVSAHLQKASLDTVSAILELSTVFDEEAPKGTLLRELPN